VFDEAVEEPRGLHQAGPLGRQDMGHRAWLLAMLDLVPQGLAAQLQPAFEFVQRGEVGGLLPQPVPRITHVLLHLPLLPTRGRVAELGLEQLVAGHGSEALVDVARLARAHAVDGRAHVVVDAPAWQAAQNSQGMVVGVEEHLVGLQRVGTQVEGPAVTELGVGHLQLDALAADDGPVLAPVELEGLAKGKHQRHEGAAACSLLGLVLTLPPAAG
jgi:hypothetical protein